MTRRQRRTLFNRGNEPNETPATEGDLISLAARENASAIDRDNFIAILRSHIGGTSSSEPIPAGYREPALNRAQRRYASRITPLPLSEIETLRAINGMDGNDLTELDVAHMRDNDLYALAMQCDAASSTRPGLPDWDAEHTRLTVCIRLGFRYLLPEDGIDAPAGPDLFASMQEASRIRFEQRRNRPTHISEEAQRIVQNTVARMLDRETLSNEPDDEQMLEHLSLDDKLRVVRYLLVHTRTPWQVGHGIDTFSRDVSLRARIDIPLDQFENVLEAARKHDAREEGFEWALRTVMSVLLADNESDDDLPGVLESLDPHFKQALIKMLNDPEKAENARENYVTARREAGVRTVGKRGIKLRKSTQ